MPSSRAAQESACSSVQCLAGSIHSIRSGARQQEGTRNQKLTCTTHPCKQDGCEEMRKVAELSSNEQRHIYMAGYLQFINFSIAYRLFYSIPRHYCCSQDSPMSSSTPEGMIKPRASVQRSVCSVCHFSILIDFKNTDILFSWIPPHYHP